jgi:hypothetical protein
MNRCLSLIILCGFSISSAEEDSLEKYHFVVKYNTTANGKSITTHALED